MMDPCELPAYDYDLPPEAIAQRPVEPRDQSRLLVLDRERGATEHHRFADLPDLLDRGDLLVMNDTRVIPARLFGSKRPGGGQVELFLIRRLEAGRWEAMLRASGRLRPGLVIDLPDGHEASVVRALSSPHWEMALPEGDALDRLLDEHGHVPLPPYIRRPDEVADRERYQTVYARSSGAVAAPTAGLHFTPQLLARLDAAGIERVMVTLHVGPGTFRPLDAAALRKGRLHREWYQLVPEAAERIRRTRSTGRRVVAVGTTATRVLETCAPAPGRVEAGSGETELFIHPPYRPRIVDALVTNFHLPRSSLLMLVAAFAGRERVLAAYAEALREGYRFYSYGDAMLVR